MKCEACGASQVQPVWGLLLCEVCARRANWRCDQTNASTREVTGTEWKLFLVSLTDWLERQVLLREDKL